MNIDEKRKQVAAQCRAVAKLATALAAVHADHAKLFEAGPSPHDDLIDMIGDRSAGFMETLGDMLNGMDAADDDADTLAPVFEEAHRLWPQEREDQ